MKDKEKPYCPLVGADGNIYNLIGLTQRTLRSHGMSKEAEEVYERVTHDAADYNEALCILMEYVEPCSQEELNETEDYEI